MSPCDATHEQAMELCVDADKLGTDGAPLFLAALALELAAADAAPQPTRTIYRISAGWIAVNAGDLAEAKRIADLVTADPETPPAFRGKLRELVAAADGGPWR